MTSNPVSDRVRSEQEDSGPMTVKKKSELVSPTVGAYKGRSASIAPTGTLASATRSAAGTASRAYNSPTLLVDGVVSSKAASGPQCEKCEQRRSSELRPETESVRYPK